MKQENYAKGMLMIILSAFFFACMNVCVRLAGNLPSIEKSFFRNFVAAVFALSFYSKITLCQKSKRNTGEFFSCAVLSERSASYVTSTLSITCLWQMPQF